MKQIVVTCKKLTPKRAEVIDLETGEVWKNGTTVAIHHRHPWLMTPRIIVEIDSPHINPREDLTITIQHEENK